MSVRQQSDKLPGFYTQITLTLWISLRMPRRNYLVQYWFSPLGNVK